MYVVTFLTLLIALVGAFSQIYSNRASKSLAHQTAIADSMMEWHSTAVRVASLFVKASSITAGGCSLAPSNPPGWPASCIGANASATYVRIDVPSGADACDAAHPTKCFTTLPADTAPAYSFYTILFLTGSPAHYYAVTFVPPAATNGDDFRVGLLCLPGSISGLGCFGTQFTQTFNTLYRQLRDKVGLSPYSYGVVTSSSVLTTPNVMFDSTVKALTYTIPGSSIIPVNSVGIISEFKTCSSC